MKTQLPDIGKISPEIFDQIILPRLGKNNNKIVVPPQHGVDIGVVDIGNNKVMVTTTDPIFVVPAYGWERAGWFALHILVSDLVTSGLPPMYITLDLNLPLSITKGEFTTFWNVINYECKKMGIAIISGHTAKYDRCDYPMVGGSTVISIGNADQYITPKMAQTGDHIIITKGAAIEASGLLAVTFHQKVAAAYGEDFAFQAEDIFWQMSVVKDALTAVEVGIRNNGITGMHDATECGVWGGLYEMALASEKGMVIDRDKIIVQKNVRKICELFAIDPYTSISEGTLLITCRPHKSKELLARLYDKGIAASSVGEVVEKEKGIRYYHGGKKYALKHPVIDPFWLAFKKAMED